MKLILCGVFLAHGAVVYTVCSTPTLVGLCGGGKEILCEVEMSSRSLALVASQREAYKTLSIWDPERVHKAGSRTPTSTKASKMPSASRFREGRIGDAQSGWQVQGDIRIGTPQSLTIRMTINAHGQIESWSVTPTITWDLKRILGQQIHKLQFTWSAPTPPPTCTVFEKKILVKD